MATVYTDFTKTPLQVIVDQINLTNGSSLTTSDLIISAPYAIVNGDKEVGITITATPESNYEGVRNIAYDRVFLSDIPKLRTTAFPRGSAVTAKDLVPQLNFAYKLDLQPEDYYDDPIPPFETNSPSETATFTFRTKPSSYLFRGSIILTLTGEETVLTNIITNTVLNGFNPPVV